MKTTERLSPIEEWTDDELLSSLNDLAVNSRQLLARLLRFLIEVERRELHLKKACSSLIEFCTRTLKLTSTEARLRVRAVHVAKQFPVVIEMIEKGEVSLSSVLRVGKRLTEENYQDLLQAISNRTQEEVTSIIAQRFPRPDIATNVRHQQPSRLPHKQRLSGETYRVGLTLSQQTMDKLERATRLMSHSNPTHDFVITIDRALDVLLNHLERSVLAATEHPRPPKPPGTTSRPPSSRARPNQRPLTKAKQSENRVTRAGRRAAFERDGEQCSFVSDDGVRCTAKSFLQIDHVHPRGKGGPGTPDNTRVLCHAHNQFLARKAYGREYIAERISASAAPGS